VNGRSAPQGKPPATVDAYVFTRDGSVELLIDDELDEAQMATWVKQAPALPGWAP
jgi:hypothetical protein